MPTINSRTDVDQIIAANGYFMDDPRVVKIVAYENRFNGATSYGIIYEGMPLDTYRATQWVRNPHTVWQADTKGDSP